MKGKSDWNSFFFFFVQMPTVRASKVWRTTGTVLTVVYPDSHFTCCKVESSNLWSFRGQNRTRLKLVIVIYKQIIDLEITRWFNCTRSFKFSTPHRIWVALFLTMSLVTHDFVSWTRNSHTGISKCTLSRDSIWQKNVSLCLYRATSTRSRTRMGS